MKKLSSAWRAISHQIRASKKLLLMLDFDGTLCPIVARPELVKLPAPARAVLPELVRHKKIKVAIISGRALPDVKRQVGIKGAFYAGNHGLELSGPKLNFVHPVAKKSRTILKKIERELTTRTKKIAGAIVEDKGLTLSLHYRQVKKEGLQNLRAIFKLATSELVRQGKIRISRGKKVLEVRPEVDWDKGKAAELLWKRLGGGKVKTTALYVGDDRTDEDAFQALQRRGITVRVGRGATRSAAQYYLENSRAVAELLIKIEEEL